ncbi:hypothetical protein PLICRDRAFT_170715 [Plicaturopsis crispa FD-325 SS-3]|nr:hypothetical protein PLICRDRAFT_170715 [Plicaturopsis crispa FD-325 SS-3]
MALRKKRRLSSYPTPSPNARQQRPTKKQRVMQKPVIKFNSKKDNIHADEPDKLAQETDATLQKYRNDETEDLEDERRVEAELSAIYPPVLPTTTTPNRHADLWAPYLRRSEHRLPISIAHVLNVLQVEHRIGLEDESMLFEHGTTWKDASFAVRGRAAW